MSSAFCSDFSESACLPALCWASPSARSFFTSSSWAALGRASYARKPAVAANAQFRRSLYVADDVPAGAALTAGNVRSIRPGFGLAPVHLPAVLGRMAARPLSKGEPLSWDMIA